MRAGWVKRWCCATLTASPSFGVLGADAGLGVWIFYVTSVLPVPFLSPFLAHLSTKCSW